MKNHKLVSIARIVFGTLALAAIITQLVTGIAAGRNIVNFFSFFTIESNILATFLLLSIGIYQLSGKSGKQIAFFRGAVTLYMTMTGIIYILLLSGNEESLQTTIPWVNIVLHYLLPVVILADWLIFPPKQHTLFRTALLWLIFPLAWLLYSLIRGEFTQWYPYPFINPITSGWPTVVVMCIIIAFGITFLTWLLTLRTRGNKEPVARSM